MHRRTVETKCFSPDVWCRPTLLLGLCSALLACSGGAAIPNTPDLSQLQSEFQNPTAALDRTSVGEALGQMPSLRQLSAGFRAAGSTTDSLDTADEQAASGSGSRLNIQGSIKVTVRCPGELEVPSYGSNGTVDMTIGVEKNLIKRGIGMRANACVMRGDAYGTPVRVQIDGPIYMDLGRDLGLRQRWVGRLLMLVAGTIDIEGVGVVDNLAARWTNDTFEYLYNWPEGNGWVIAAITSQGAVSVRDSQTTWSCPDGATCSTF